MPTSPPPTPRPSPSTPSWQVIPIAPRRWISLKRAVWSSPAHAFTSKTVLADLYPGLQRFFCDILGVPVVPTAADLLEELQALSRRRRPNAALCGRIYREVAQRLAARGDVPGAGAHAVLLSATGRWLTAQQALVCDQPHMAARLPEAARAHVFCLDPDADPGVARLLEHWGVPLLSQALRSAAEVPARSAPDAALTAAVRGFMPHLLQFLYARDRVAYNRLYPLLRAEVRVARALTVAYTLDEITWSAAAECALADGAPPARVHGDGAEGETVAPEESAEGHPREGEAALSEGPPGPQSGGVRGEGASGPAAVLYVREGVAFEHCMRELAQMFKVEPLAVQGLLQSPDRPRTLRLLGVPERPALPPPDAAHVFAAVRLPFRVRPPPPEPEAPAPEAAEPDARDRAQALAAVLHGAVVGRVRSTAGRAGEEFVCRYLRRCAGVSDVRWFNAEEEGGQSYDITFRYGGAVHYVEVKASMARAPAQLAVSPRQIWTASKSVHRYHVVYVTGVGKVGTPEILLWLSAKPPPAPPEGDGAGPDGGPDPRGPAAPAAGDPEPVGSPAH